MVIQRTVEKASPQSIRALHTWLSHSSDFLTNATVREPSPTHRGLFATKQIQPFGLILRIPASHLISSHLARRTPHVAAILSEVQNDNLHEQLPDSIGDSAALLLFLMSELSAGTNSRYYTWFQTLPKQFTNPFSVPKHVVDTMLQGTPVHALIDVLRTELREMYDRWFVPYAIAGYPSRYRESTCTWETFVYIHAVVESRAFKIDSETMLVPYADMANHKSVRSGRSNAKARGWTVAGSPLDARRMEMGVGVGRGLELYAGERGVREGEEVCISYGVLPNWELLLHYGFAEAGNLDDFVDVGLEVPEDETVQVYMAKMVILGMGMKSPDIQLDHRLGMRDTLPISLMASMRVLCLNEEEVKNVSVRDTDFARALNARNEGVVTERLEALLVQLRDRFEEREIGRGCEGYEMFCGYCLTYVRWQKWIICTALRELRGLQRVVEV